MKLGEMFFISLQKLFFQSLEFLVFKFYDFIKCLSIKLEVHFTE